MQEDPTASELEHILKPCEVEVGEVRIAAPIPVAQLECRQRVRRQTFRRPVQACHARERLVVQQEEPAVGAEIGRAACRAKVCQYVESPVDAGSIKKKKIKNY